MKKPVNFSSASVNQKQFWIEIRFDVSRKQVPKHIAPDLDQNCLILKVFLIFCYFSEKGHFEENQKAIQIYPVCKDLFFLELILDFCNLVL